MSGIDLSALTPVELCAARLDGDVFELGRGYLPADAAETPRLRAATVAALFRDDLAAVGMSAAWVHGAAELEPDPHTAQPIGGGRVHRHRSEVRARARPVDPADLVAVGPILATSRAVTLAELALGVATAASPRPDRTLVARTPPQPLEQAFRALLREEGLVAPAVAWLGERVSPHKRAALALLTGSEPGVRPT